MLELVGLSTSKYLKMKRALSVCVNGNVNLPQATTMKRFSELESSATVAKGKDRSGLRGVRLFLSLF